MQSVLRRRRASSSSGRAAAAADSMDIEMQWGGEGESESGQKMESTRSMGGGSSVVVLTQSPFS